MFAVCNAYVREHTSDQVEHHNTRILRSLCFVRWEDMRAISFSKLSLKKYEVEGVRYHINKFLSFLFLFIYCEYSLMLLIGVVIIL